MSILLTKSQRERLIKASAFGTIAVDDMIKQLRKENPKAFLEEEQLITRVFVDQPASPIVPFAKSYNACKRPFIIPSFLNATENQRE